MLVITNQDIAYAEQILFGRTGVFDAQRVDYIKATATCDLQAVPGSGKTTVLLAKLLIMERHLPFNDGSSVLVLSHTNVAVDEIKKRIGRYCPKLFSAPHFVGTIQSFVDKFLAIPYYVSVYAKRPMRIDDEIYEERAARFMSVSFSGFSGQTLSNARYFLINSQKADKLRLSLTATGEALTIPYLGSAITIAKPRPSSKNWVDWTAQEKENIRRWLLAFKKQLLAQGYLCFDDAYYLAEKYIVAFPQVISILQQRFKYVFVDEMQDMEVHQYSLLEKLFFTGASGCLFHRIGDKNQSIFGHDAATKHTWTDRTTVYRITGSQRLSPDTARIVERLAVYPIGVTGLKTKGDGTPIGLLPHVLVYNNNTIANVIATYANLILQYQASGHIPQQMEHPCKAICWNGNKENTNTKVHDYFPSLEKKHQRSFVNHPCLEGALYPADDPSGQIRALSRSILNALVHILRLEDVTDERGLFFTKTSLVEYLQKGHPSVKEGLVTIVYQAAKLSCEGQHAAALGALKGWIPQLLTAFGKTPSKCQAFLNDRYVQGSGGAATTLANPNLFEANGLSIEVGTVHACKGQTHTATLYLESFYQRDVAGSGNFESERLATVIKGAPVPNPLQQYTEQSLKMAYVGFSRPTHLLCFAVHEDRYNARLHPLSVSEWQVVRVV